MHRLLLFALAILLASPAAAAVPDPGQSTVPCLTACPQGDIPVVITVRDLNGNPVASSRVSLEFCGDNVRASTQALPIFAFCCDVYCGNLEDVVQMTGPDGRAVFHLPGGGSTTLVSGVNVRADGIILANRTITTPDLNRDFLVDDNDLAIATDLLGSFDPAADYNCDGVVDLNDLGVILAHSDHACFCPTPSNTHSWGRVKIRYR